jgi:heterodisulfide reductase subunit A
VEGYLGNYLTTVKRTGKKKAEEIEHGIIVIATGANETQPKEYLYDGENVVTQLELEAFLEADTKPFSKIKNVVMIQCVGSRDEEHAYCSRVCCTQAVKNAIRLKELNPKMNIFILYRDIRTYGFNETYYQKARGMGIIFIRYDEENKPQVSRETVKEKEALKVLVRDHVLGVDMVIHPDKIVLAPAMVPQADAGELSQMLKIPLNEDNFFMEAHVKLRPVDFSAEGIFLAGLAHAPKMMDETISQAKAAAERACSIISSSEYISEANIASVDAEICAGCGLCVSVCPYGAPGLVSENGRQICQINTALCKGCGNCSTVCPSGAMQQLGFKEEQTLEMINQALLQL